jgi:RimJ/RimL family protein N-acetyltransferase
VPEFRLETERLVLRSWCDADVAPLSRICADPVVMATLGPVLDLEGTRALVDRERGYEAQWGHTFWVVERREDHRLIGKCGIVRGRIDPILNKVEIGWRLASDCWGHGYATEAARACVDWAFGHLDDDAVWAVTAAANRGSRAVMDRIGMQHLPHLDFDHPALAADDPLRPHVTYRLARLA